MDTVIVRTRGFERAGVTAIILSTTVSVVLFCVPLFAQTDTGRILGTVLDQARSCRVRTSLSPMSIEARREG